MFAREGYLLILAAAVLALVLALIGLQFGTAVRVVLGGLGVLVLGFTLYFFRDPQRTPPPGAGHLILAPADGKVVQIVDVEEPLYLKGPARQVSIFLSPLDVHVNRVPADGVVEFVRYVPGDYLVAWHPKASEKNERSELGLRHPGGTKILFKQIAGAVARRIVFHVQEGDTVQAGERFGIVKFGSRMDVLVPPGIPIDVQVGDRVRAGETILGRLPAAPPGDAPVAAAEAREEAAR
ncbi:MAG: hypothetical protein KatS3mg044_1095 [Rhodothermaceae bacterium]|nr:MAG: hypothetical protein KatS3mg044_1095 [Rhodothermaceae bacterium]